MISYEDLTFWQNKSRRESITEFINQIKAYFNNVDFDPYAMQPIESDEALKIRSWLNKRVGAINQIVYSADVSPSVTYTPPPAIGGYVQRINIIENFALIHQYSIPPIEVIDVLEKAQGIYEADFGKSVIRTFNPFFWIGKVVNLIASSPFKFLNSLGFSGNKVEKSKIGKLIKGTITLISWSITIFVTLWGFLVILGVIKPTDTLPILFRRLGF